MAKGILIDHVFKVFGDEPEQAVALAREGLSKQEILARTGQSIGVGADVELVGGEVGAAIDAQTAVSSGGVRPEGRHTFSAETGHAGH